MSNEAEKHCIACGQPILAHARKCPHCRSWQYRMYTAWFHPATWIALILILGGLMLIPMGSIFYEEFYKRGTAFQHSASISVVESKIHYGVEKESAYISCIGTLRNRSDVTWQELHFQVRFFDASGALIDTLSDHDYSLVLLPHSDAPFRVRGRADKTADQYVSHKVEVTWAKDARE
jgi:hypothetical protein